jgi:putative flippase GtrA
MIAIRTLPSRLEWLALSPAARPLRFVGTGGVAASVQLALLAAMTSSGWDDLLADGLAFLLAAQVNFILSMAFTWRDRRGSGPLHRRWLLYHGSIATMALLNMLVFVLMRSLLSTLIAAVLGIAAAGIGNYLASDRLVFRHAPEVRQ